MPARPAVLTQPQGKEAMMKVRSSLRSLKSRPGSVLVRRGRRVRVVNRTNRRWNGRQG
jgi:large subunit ribosomal protein L36